VSEFKPNDFICIRNNFNEYLIVRIVENNQSGLLIELTDDNYNIIQKKLNNIMRISIMHSKSLEEALNYDYLIRWYYKLRNNIYTTIHGNIEFVIELKKYIKNHYTKQGKIRKAKCDCIKH